MKKKYLALLLSCMVVCPCFLTSCGKSSDETVAEEDDEDDEEDEDEDDEDDDDKDDKEDSEENVKPEESVIVMEIPDDDLYAQIDVFLDNREDIFFPESEDYLYTSCAVCDLDFNGRCELVLSGGSWYGAELENRIYEINEAGNGYYIPEYAFLGIESEQRIVPKLSNWNSLDAFYDKNDGRVHYLIPQSISEYSDLNGFCYCDVSLKGGVIQNDIYGMYQYHYDDGYQAVYFGPNGEMTQDEFNEYIDSYPGDHVVKSMTFGTYEGTAYYPLSDGDIETMDSEALREILADSYRVFSGTMTYSEFRRIHSTHSNDYDDAGNLLRDSVGSWGLYVTDTEGDVTYYTPDSEFYMTVDIYEDGSFDLYRFLNTDHEMTISGVLEADENDDLSYTYTPESDDEMGGAALEITVSEVNMDGRLVISTSSMYGNEYMGGSTWYFDRID